MATVLGDSKVLNNAMTDSTNTVPYWGYYAGQNYFDQDPMSGAPGRQFMDALRKYDPNAQFTQTTMGESGSPVWTLQYDASKMPNGHKIGNGQIDMNGGDYSPQYYSIGDAGGFDPKNAPYGGNFRADLYNSNAINNDPVWGKTTDPRNVKPDSPSWVDKFGPMLVGGFGMMAPMAFGAAGLGMADSAAAIGGANGGLAATEGGMAGLNSTAPSWVLNAAKGAQGQLEQSGNGQFNPFALGALSIPFLTNNPIMAQLGKMGLNYAGSQYNKPRGS